VLKAIGVPAIREVLESSWGSVVVAGCEDGLIVPSAEVWDEGERGSVDVEATDVTTLTKAEVSDCNGNDVDVRDARYSETGVLVGRVLSAAAVWPTPIEVLVGAGLIVEVCASLTGVLVGKGLIEDVCLDTSAGVPVVPGLIVDVCLGTSAGVSVVAGLIEDVCLDTSAGVPVVAGLIEDVCLETSARVPVVAGLNEDV